MATTTVPDLINRSALHPNDEVSEAEIEADLHTAQLTLGVVTKVSEPRRPLGPIRMSPPPGATVDQWREVRVTLNVEHEHAIMTPFDEPEDEEEVTPHGYYRMPSVKGLTLKEVNKLLAPHALIDEENIRQDFSSSVREGLFIESEPGADELVRIKGRKPTLVRSLGKKPNHNKSILRRWK